MRSASAIRAGGNAGSPVVNAAAYDRYARHVGALRAGDTRRRGGERLTDGERARGYFVTPVLAEAPLHPLWREEMFLPILMLHRYMIARRRCNSQTTQLWVSRPASTVVTTKCPVP